MPYFCDIDTRADKVLAPGVTTKTFWQTQLLVSIVTLDADAVVPLHSHPHEQAGTVIEGEVTMTIDGESRVLRTGDTYLIPGDVPHMAVAHNGMARTLDVFGPVREEYQY